MYAERTGNVKAGCTQGGMADRRGILHHAYMSRTAKGHYLREWRQTKGLSLEEAAAKVEELSLRKAAADVSHRPISMTHATLSRIERGKLPYNQQQLELLSELYGTTVASLLGREPNEPSGLLDINDELTPAQRAQLVEFARIIKRQAG